MTTFIEKIIRERLPELATSEKWSFLKFCTPTSGATREDKVIFLVFRAGDKAPFLCVKTVRSYDARGVIIKNFENLQTLHALAHSASFPEIFAEPLFLHDDGEMIFSVERTCTGRRAQRSDLGVIATEYSTYHSVLAKQSSEKVSLASIAEGLIVNSVLPDTEQKKLRRYLATLPPTPDLPKIVAHGDLTLDNILIDGRKIHIIDYDYVQISTLPGYDLFCLLFKVLKRDFATMHPRFFSEYFDSIGVVVHDARGIIFTYYLTELIAKKPQLLVDTDAKKIIRDFEVLYEIK